MKWRNRRAQYTAVTPRGYFGGIGGGESRAGIGGGYAAQNRRKNREKYLTFTRARAVYSALASGSGVAIVLITRPTALPNCPFLVGSATF